MSEIPKIVRQRLHQAGGVSHAHPDANLLTAFGERSLTGPERVAVLDHLSYCAECREVVALALPPVESLQPAMQFSPGRKLAWPILRWSLTSAGVLALAVFGFVEYGHQDGFVKMAKNSPAPAAMQRDQSAAVPLAQNQFKAKEEAPQASAAETGSAAAVLQKEQHESPSPPKIELSRSLRNGSLAQGPRQNQWQQQTANDTPSPAGVLNSPESKQALAAKASDVLSGANENAEVQSQPVQTDMDSRAVGSVIAGNRPSSEPVPPRPSDAEVSRAKSAPTTPAPARVEAPLASGLQVASASALPLSAPTWTVDSGRLRRSVDRGQTWQDVNVTASADNMELAVSSRRAAKQSATRDTQRPPAAPVFRAVAANGPDVWAGGARAILYHSSDAGAHWTRVIPASESATLSGDILSLEFRDTQNGRVSTSTGEVWTTADSGQSWNKQ